MNLGSFSPYVQLLAYLWKAVDFSGAHADRSAGSFIFQEDPLIETNKTRAGVPMAPRQFVLVCGVIVFVAMALSGCSKLSRMYSLRKSPP
jgi:hypothetical protein